MARNLLFTLLFNLFFIAPTSVFGFHGDDSLGFLPIKGEVCEAPAPDSFRITSTGGNFISLAWIPAWQGATHVLTVSEKNASGGWNTQFIFPNVEGSTYTVDSLKGGKEYRFRIATKCSSGDPSELSAYVDGIALIVELTLLGRTPKNPTPVSCHGIEYKKHNWVGFMVSGEGSSNIFEVVPNEVSESPFAYIKRVYTSNSIVAVNPQGAFPNEIIPVIEDVPSPFRIIRLFADGPEPEDIGKIEIIKNNTNPPTIDFCVESPSTIPWKNQYTFRALTAKETIKSPPGGADSDIGIRSVPTHSNLKVQNPFKENISIFLPNYYEFGKKINLSLYNSKGQIIDAQEIEIFSSQLFFPANDLPSGVYFLQIATENELQVFKLFQGF